MRQNLFLNYILLLYIILLTCSKEKDPITKFTNGTYSGKYWIKQDTYLQYGQVNLIFDNTHYMQFGTSEYPCCGKFQSEGSFSVLEDTIVFNPSCDEWSVAEPIWFLCGEFTYQCEKESTIFLQILDTSDIYKITINDSVVF
jgi:hypothetical protein